MIIVVMVVTMGVMIEVAKEMRMEVVAEERRRRDATTVTGQQGNA